jgi:hypothetical protein
LVICKIADSLNRIETLYHGRRWLVQRSDLALYDNPVKAGLKLWNYPAFALVLEIVVPFRGCIYI